MQTCEQHINIKDTVQDHEKRIRNLETNSIRLAERMEGLCKELASLTQWVKALVFMIMTTAIGFTVWYIQSLPR